MKNFKSIKFKLFSTLCISILIILLLLIVVNSFVLERLYLFIKKESLINTYSYINRYYNSSISEVDIELELEKMAVNNDFDIMIKDEKESVYISNKDFISSMGELEKVDRNIEYSIFNKGSVIYAKDDLNIRNIQDQNTGVSFILLVSKLDCRI